MHTGHYQVRGAQVIHYVDVSLFPNWVGTRQLRSFGGSPGLGPSWPL